MLDSGEHELDASGAFVEDSSGVVGADDVSGIGVDINDNGIPGRGWMFVPRLADVFKIESGEPSVVEPVIAISGDLEIFDGVFEEFAHHRGVFQTGKLTRRNGLQDQALL